MTAKKNDKGKPPMALISNVAMRGLADVLAFGAEKYQANGWRSGMEWSRYVSAAMRHIMAWNDGEDVDPESGLSHLDHAACCLMFLSEFEKTGNGTDDRYKKPMDFSEGLSGISPLKKKYGDSDGWVSYKQAVDGHLISSPNENGKTYFYSDVLVRGSQLMHSHKYSLAQYAETKAIRSCEFKEADGT